MREEKKKLELDDYRITIIGEQTLDGESDRIEVITEGNFKERNDRFYIAYKEYDEECPEDYYSNLVKVERDMVTITRRGPMSSQLMLELNKRHQCVYQTAAGDLTIGVFTKTLDNRLTESGGRLEVSYTLDFNTDLVSENRFIITVEKKEEE